MNANTQVTVKAELFDGLLKLRALQWREAMSQPFEAELELLHDSFDLDADKLLGHGLAVAMQAPGEPVRHLHGVVTQVALTGGTGRFAQYAVSLRPWLWLLQQAVDCRIFQQLTAPQILIDHVFKRHGFDAVDNRLTGRYATRELCVQYAESDFDFAQRLMSDEGIAYHFRHEARRHVLVLTDSASGREAATGCETLPYRPQSAAEVDALRGIAQWHEAREVVPGAAVVRRHDPAKPRQPVEGMSSAPAQQGHANFEQMAFGAVLADDEAAREQARRWREALQGLRCRYRGTGHAPGLGAGHVFKLSGHRRAALNQSYLVTEAVHRLVSFEHELGAGRATPSFRHVCDLVAVVQAQGFRPPRGVPRPRMHGPQVARVEGPAGSEIHTDEQGRVKVRFPWDRGGARAAQATCWLRVAQQAAGAGFGAMVLPRVGDEVIVDFLNGDPDQPLVTGRVYNGERKPPYALPQNKTRSVWRSHSTPHGRDDQFNELRFEDKAGEEEVFLQAERDCRRVVKNNDHAEIGRAGCADGSQTVKVWKDRHVTLETGNDLLQVKAGTHTVEAARSITLKVGASSLTIGPDGITLQAPRIEVKANATLGLSSPVTTMDGNATLVLKGGLVTIN